MNAEEIARNYYVLLYPKDKPLSEMTPYERGVITTFVSLVASLQALLIEEMESMSYMRYINEMGKNKIYQQGLSDAIECVRRTLK